MTARNLVGAAAVLLLPVFSEGKDLQLSSAWAPAPVKIDGTADTWSALLKPLGDVPMVIGVQNDRDFLYLCFKTSDVKLKKELAMVGLTVWADGTGKAKKGFGVRFPARRGPGGMRAEGGPQGARPEGGPPAPPQADERSGLEAAHPAEDIELIGPTKEDRLRVELGGD